MSAKVTGCEWDPEGELTWSESEVTGPSGYDLSIPWFHPSHPPGCPLHGCLHWLLSKRGTWRRTLPWEVRDPQVTRWIPLETLQRTSRVQTRPVFNWHSLQSNLELSNRKQWVNTPWNFKWNTNWASVSINEALSMMMLQSGQSISLNDPDPTSVWHGYDFAQKDTARLPTHTHILSVIIWADTQIPTHVHGCTDPTLRPHTAQHYAELPWIHTEI